MSSQSGEFAIQPILNTNDIGRLSSFYAELFGAEEYMRVPGKKGPFFVMLRLGNASLGIVDYKKGAEVAPGRITVAVFVENVDDLLPRVEPAGGKVLGPANDMPWGHRSPTSPTRTATRSTSPSSSEPGRRRSVQLGCPGEAQRHRCLARPDQLTLSNKCSKITG